MRVICYPQTSACFQAGPAAATASGSQQAPESTPKADPRSVNGSTATANKPKSVASPANGNAPPVAGGASGGAAILARMRAQKAAAAVKQKPDETDGKTLVTFLFASQTGTSEEIARSLHDEAVSRKHSSKCLSMNDWAADGISASTTPIVVVIASTTGDGDCPDNSGKGLLALKRRSDPLTGMKFSVMGLGDSNYTNFMKIPRTVARLMRKHGAEEFYPSKEADEVDGLEDIVDAWRDNLWAALDAAMASKVHLPVQNIQAN